MSWSFERTHIRVLISGNVVATLEEPTITEDFGQLARTAEFSLAALPDPEPAEGDSVEIQLIDGDAGTLWTIYAGTINTIDVESDGPPADFSFAILCVDQLERLSATKKGGDLNLAGMTDGAIWKAVADYCGVVYDDADIAETGFTFGARGPLSWKDDSSTNGQSIIQELDDVTGFHTMTIGGNRVIRFPVDWTPDGSSTLYRSYTKSTSTDWAGHHRTHGDRDAIQSVWKVTGEAVESSDGSCTSTPWAYASSGNAQLARRHRRRGAPGSFSSDFIQDESLAESIVRRLMRRFNRTPDRASLVTTIDANLHPGSVVRLVDPTYGIAAAGKRCLTTSVQRSGLQMTADLECGAAGSEGSVSHGIDKVCGDDHTDPNWDDGFDPSDPDWPPVDAGDAIDLSAIWDIPIIGGWTIPITEGAPCGTPPVDPDTCNSEAWAAGIDVESGHDWEILGTVTLTADTQAWSLGVDSADGIYRIRIAGGAYYDPLVGQFAYEVLTPFGNRRASGYAPLSTEHVVKLIYRDATKVLEFFAELDTGICYRESIDVPAATMGGASTIQSITGSPTRSAESIHHQCGDYVPPDPPDDLVAGPWTVDTGTWLHPGTYIENTGTADSKIHLTSPLELVGVSDGPHTFTITGSFTIADENGKIEFRLSAPTSGDGDLFGLYEFAGKAWRTEFSGSVGDRHTHIEMGSLAGTKNGAGFNSLSFSDVLDFTLTWNRATATVTMTVSDQHGHTDTQTTTDGGANDSYCDGLDIYLSVFAAVHFGGSNPGSQIHLSSLIVTDEEA